MSNFLNRARKEWGFMNKYDVIILGAGPAGISASLYAKRANLDVLVLYYEKSQLELAHKIDNYYGFVGGVNGKQLFDNGIKQAIDLGINALKEEVTNIELAENNSFKVSTHKQQFEAKAIILATGNKKSVPNIEGITNLEGKGVSYCAICDGFFLQK